MTSVTDESLSCAILADRNSVLADRLRDLLRTTFGTVFTVGDSESLLEGARRLAPGLIVVDLGFDEKGTAHLLRHISAAVPDARIIALSFYDEAEVARAAMAEGARGVVLKRSISDDLMRAVDAVLSGGTFVSAGFESDPDDPDPATGLRPCNGPG